MPEDVLASPAHAMNVMSGTSDCHYRPNQHDCHVASKVEAHERRYIEIVAAEASTVAFLIRLER